MSIEFMHKVAELNLCKACFEKYEAIIEPNLKIWRKSPLLSWNQTELMVTSIVMKLKGVYKDEKTILFTLNPDENDSEFVDVEAFQKIKRMSFKSKIKYLKEENVLKRHSYKILDIARQRRNKIHSAFDLQGITEEDYKLFESINPIVQNLFFAVNSYQDRIDMYTMMTCNSEDWAKKLLESISI